MSLLPFLKANPDPTEESVVNEARRQLLRGGLGAVALSQLLSAAPKAEGGVPGLPGLPHFAPKAKRVIYLHMVGAPPQHDLFDWKPKMKDWFDKDLPESIRSGQRLTTMVAGQV